MSDMTTGFTVYEYLGVVAAVNLHIHQETTIAWTSIHTGAGILVVHDSIGHITSLITATGIMGPTTNI